MLPSRRVRRITGPLLLAALVAAVALLPLLVVLAVLVSIWLPGRWRGLRLLAFALVYLVLEVGALVAVGVLWVLSGFGRRLHTPAFQGAHYTVLRLVLAALMRAAQRLFALRLVTDGQSWSPLDDGNPARRTRWSCCPVTRGPGTPSCSCTR